MHLVLSLVEVLTLLGVLSSQQWNRNFYPIKRGFEFLYPFQQHGYNNYAARFPYRIVNPNFLVRYGSDGISNGQKRNMWPGLETTQNPYQMFLNFKNSKNLQWKGLDGSFSEIGRIGNGKNNDRTFYPISNFPFPSNSIPFFPNQNSNFPKSMTGLTFQANNGIPEAIQNINNVPFFNPVVRKLNGPEGPINRVNTFDNKIFQDPGWEFKQNPQTWALLPDSVLNSFQLFRNDNKWKAFPSPLVHYGGQAAGLNSVVNSESQNAATFIPTQLNNNQNGFYKFESQPPNVDIQNEKEMFNQRKLDGSRSQIKHNQIDIKPSILEYPLQTIPSNKNVEQHNLNSLANVDTSNSLLPPTTGNANNNMLENRVSWPSHQSNVQFHDNSIHQVFSAEDQRYIEPLIPEHLSQTNPINKNTEQYNINLLPNVNERNSVFEPVTRNTNSFRQDNRVRRPPYERNVQYSDPSAYYSSDNSFQMKDEQLHTLFTDEKSFDIKEELKNVNFPSIEKHVESLDSESNSPAFRDNFQNSEKNHVLNKQASSTDEFGKNGPTQEENADNFYNFLISPSNKAAAKKTPVNDVLKPVPKKVNDWKYGNNANLGFENIVDEISIQNRVTTPEIETNQWDNFTEDFHFENEILFEEDPPSQQI